MQLKKTLTFKWEYRKIRRFLYKKLKNQIKNQHIFSITIHLRDDYYLVLQRTTCSDIFRIHDRNHNTLIKIVDYNYALQNMLKPEYYIMELSFEKIKKLFEAKDL